MNDRRRQQAKDVTWASGYMGAIHLPLEVSMDPSLSDTFIGTLLDIQEAARRQRDSDLSEGNRQS